jgi:hypothetical protein
MRVAQIYLILMGVMSLVFGVVYLFWPATMTDPMGFGVLAPAAVTDVRATYGGFQIGRGAFLLWCLRPPRVRAGLLLMLLSVGAVAACRAIGLLIDGQVTSNLQGVLVFEVVLTVVTLVLLLRTPAPAPHSA